MLWSLNNRAGYCRAGSAPAFCAVIKAGQFITRSSNKIDGTGKYREPRSPPFVVGAGNADREEELHE
jgi:hypothetical protein